MSRKGYRELTRDPNHPDYRHRGDDSVRFRAEMPLKGEETITLKMEYLYIRHTFKRRCEKTRTWLCRVRKVMEMEYHIALEDRGLRHRPLTFADIEVSWDREPYEPFGTGEWLVELLCPRWYPKEGVRTYVPGWTSI